MATNNFFAYCIEGVICTDSENKITVWNPVCERIFKWKSNEVLGKNFFDVIVAAEERRKYYEHHEAIIDFVDGKINTYPWIDKFKKEVNIITKICKIVDGTDNGLILFFIDAQFYDKDMPFAHILNSAGYLMFTKNLDFVYTNININVERAFDVRLEQVVGKTDFELFSVQVAEKRREKDLEILKSGEVINSEEVMDYNGHEIVVFNTRSVKTDLEGNVVGINVIGRDITEYHNHVKKMNEFEKKSIQASEQMALQASKLKTRFMANVSHEIRTPINGIMGMNNLLLETKLSEEQKDYVESTQKLCSTLITMINDILDFSKSESDKMTIELVNMNLNELLHDIQIMYLHACNNKGIALTVRKDFETSMIKSDYGRLRQILSNLLSNAIKFTSRGHIELKVEKKIDNNNNVILEFSLIDTGIGIEQAKIESLFEPFTQADESMTRRYGGTGLGLSICKSLVTLLKGEIHIKSVHGAGTTIWFTLPFVEGELETVVINKDEEVKQKLEILVVDDNVMNLKVMVKILEKMGHKCTTSINGLEALQTIELNPTMFDVVLMDCQMPIMDGYEASAEIRKITNKISIVAMTANVLEGEKEKCIKAGMNDYMSKPVMKNDLIKMLNKWSK